MDSLFQTIKRVCDNLSKLSDERGSLADFMEKTVKISFEELTYELFQTISLQARKYNSPIHEVALENMKKLLSRMIALMHEDLADRMRRNKTRGYGDTDMDYKLFLLEVESYFLNFVQNTYLPQILKKITEDTDALVMITEIAKERIEEFRTKFTGIEDTTEFRAVAKNVFDLVMDVISTFNQAKEAKEPSGSTTLYER